MKRGFYLRLALDGMRKNKRLYLPYLFTCAGMVMMLYILAYLSYSPLLRQMRGGSTMESILTFGTFVIAVFAAIFLLYANSFLIRRRNREFGLYNILGMNKNNISRILLWETVLTALFALTAGLLGGLLFSKLGELYLVHIMHGTIGYDLSVEPRGVAAALLFFGVIFALLLLLSLARVRLSKPLDLLRSESAGEKPPKANWLFALAGVVILGAAYYLAVSIDEPLTALMAFFIAVLMVIVATYLLFIAGSVALCKLLQKKKSYYYQPAHFVSVSSMAFRMKRNGAGLASICILATMVLVMISSTSCLYFGGEDALRGICPYDVTMETSFVAPEYCRAENLDVLRDLAHEAAGGRESGLIAYTLLETSGYFDKNDGSLLVDGTWAYTMNTLAPDMLEQLRNVNILPLDDYNRLSGQSVTLSSGEALIWSSGAPYPCDTLTVEGGETLRVHGLLTELPIQISTEDTFATCYYVVVPDWKAYASPMTAYLNGIDDRRTMALSRQYCSFDLSGVGDEEQVEISRACSAAIRERFEGEGLYDCGSSCYVYNQDDFFSLYGSLFFLGIVLSIVFIAAAALIIYYKQLSEGYEDESRFGIMQKVGMTKREIKSAVNSQVLTVFFAPLLLAGVHLAFAFPFVHKIVRLFGVVNTPLLMLTNVACFLAFAVFYAFVYRETAKTYYAIVSDGEARR